MFNSYKNYQEANNILKIFEPLFKYSKYTDEYYDGFNDSESTKYIAQADEGWQLITQFYGPKKDNMIRKKFYPYVSFEKDLKSKMTHYNGESVAERFQKSKEIAEFLQTTYTPDFDRVIEIIDIFIEQGLHSGMFNSVDVKKYKKHMISHMHINHYHGQIKLWDKNYASIKFNNVLQKGTGKNGTHFKKSFICINVVYLVDSMNEVNIYFQIKLPTSATNKNTYVLPLAGGDILYLVGDSESLRITPIDKIISMPLKKDKLAEYFKGEIENEIKTTISKTLKIKKTELDNLSADELKDYFMLVEMIKI
jgi:hypothetical protein